MPIFRVMVELLALTYSEFDNHVGPQLLYQFPADIVSKDDFENMSEYVIVGKHLCEKAISVRADHYQYVNYSVAIDNPKYERNALLFAVGVVLSLDADMDVYTPILRRLATTLIALEQEREYLFQHSSKETLQVILQSAYEQLAYRQQAFLQFDESNLLTIELFQTPSPPVVINNYDVPVLLYDKIGLIGLPWDITIQHLIHHINGENHVKRMSKIADMDLDCVKRSLQLLIYYGCCIITDVLHFTNVYTLNPVAFDLLEVCNYVDLNLDTLIRSTRTVGSASGTGKLAKAIPGPGIHGGGDTTFSGDTGDRSTCGVNPAVLPGRLRSGYEILEEIQLFCCASIAQPPSFVDICQVLFRFSGSLPLRDVIMACLGLGSADVKSTASTSTCCSSGSNGNNHTSNSNAAGGGGGTSGSTDGDRVSCLSRINVKKLIAILLAKKVIRRMHEYPVYISGRQTLPQAPQAVMRTQFSPVGSAVVTSTSATDAENGIVEPTRLSGKGWNVDKERWLLTGNQSLESLCCAFNVLHSDIVSKPNVSVVYK